MRKLLHALPNIEVDPLITCVVIDFVFVNKSWRDMCRFNSGILWLFEWCSEVEAFR